MSERSITPDLGRAYMEEHARAEALSIEVERLREALQRIQVHYERHASDDYGAWLREECARV